MYIKGKKNHGFSVSATSHSPAPPKHLHACPSGSNSDQKTVLLSLSPVNGVGKMIHLCGLFSAPSADRCFATFFSNNVSSCCLEEKVWWYEFIHFVFSLCLCVCVFTRTFFVPGGHPCSLQGGGMSNQNLRMKLGLSFYALVQLLVQAHNPLSKIVNSNKTLKTRSCFCN